MDVMEKKDIWKHAHFSNYGIKLLQTDQLINLNLVSLIFTIKEIPDDQM